MVKWRRKWRNESRNMKPSMASIMAIRQTGASLCAVAKKSMAKIMAVNVASVNGESINRNIKSAPRRRGSIK
jgi:hypothetical protein